MLLFFKRLFLVVTAALLTQTTFGFALLGPRDTWQTSAIGYDPQGDLGDIGGPKNLAEEWRWVLPKISYAFDPSFINFFGTNGVQAVEDAINLFNRELTNSLAAMTDAQLRAKPRDTKRIHPTAQALGVLDLKSYTMGLLAEQLGLAGAVRWTWAIRDQQVFNNNVTNYSIIQRNFDPFTLKPTRYVNDHKWTYFVGTFPTFVGNGTYQDAAEIPIDQAGDGPFIGSAVSAAVGEDLLSTGIRSGEYYSALSRDDIGGLRYIYRSFNVNSEFLPIAGPRDSATFAPSIRFVDTNQIVFIQGLDAFTFFTNALFSTNLQAQFTNLVILSTNVTLTNIITTNFVVTNLVSGGLLTRTDLPTIISNLDLFLFSERSRTNDPNTLRGFYPNLIITKTNSGFERVVTETFSLTNGPYGAANEVYISTNFVTNLIATYRYEYANVITNYASAVTDLELQEVRRAPFSSPNDFLLVTNITRVRVPMVSGGFYILDRSTNAALIGYTFNDEFGVPLLRVTNHVVSTNLVFQFTNIFDPTDVRVLNIANRFTNVVYGAYPVELNGINGQATVAVLTTNRVARYEYRFAFGTNLFLFPPGNGNTNVILETITFTNGGPLRITRTNVFTDIPTGTVLILDTNRFVLTGDPPIETSGLVTNVIIAFTNAVTGEFITQQLIYQTNSMLFPAFPVTFITPTVPQLHAGVDTIRFVRHPYLDYLDQTTGLATNTYTIRVQINGVNYVQSVQRIAGPDIIFSTFDQTTTGGFPVATSRTLQWQNGTTVIAAGATFDRGPGQIVPGSSTISFSTLTPSWIIQTPGAMTEDESFLYLQWGSFDSRTLVPRLYPEDITGQLQTLEDIALRRNPAP